MELEIQNTSNNVTFHEMMEIDMMMLLAKKGYSFYRELFKKINTLIKANTPNFAIHELVRKEISKYCKNGNISNHYEYMLKTYDTESSITSLPFDDKLIRVFFECTEKVDENTKKKYFEFTIINSEKQQELIYTSYRAKTKNAWQDFIKNWWFKDSNYNKRIECYMDVYNAIVEMETLNQSVETTETNEVNETTENTENIKQE